VAAHNPENKENKVAGLSKSRILIHRQCARRLWLQTNHPELAEEQAATASRMAAGNRVGELARSHYPGGLLIDGDNLAKALEDTRQALAEPPRPIFEATFDAGGVLIRADILRPESSGYRMIEVKSSTKVKDYHYEDAAVQVWVAKAAGLPLTGIDIAHINNGFVYPGGGDYSGLFAHADISESVTALENLVPDWAGAARETLEARNEPDVATGEQCSNPFPCPFIKHCSPQADENAYPPEILPYGKSLAAELRAEGYADLRDVPEERLTDPKHLRVWRASVNDQPELDATAGDELRALPYPRYYLDFETIQFAVPIWAGTRPYQQIPFQWSCHVESADGSIEHRAFLAEGDVDPRRAFAESLIAALETDGPVLVYNAGFESARMKETAMAFPEFAPALHAAVDRIVDLLPIARDHYYHPAMRGSWSIKVVAPAIAPELTYEGLEVAGGGMAMEAFAEILDPATKPERRQQLRSALLEYCKLDSLANLKVAQYFQNGG
jgi:hypothetical protein